MTENRYRPLILDASALITGFNPADVENEQYTVPLVEEELKRGLTSVRLKTSIRTGKLKVKTPKKAFLEEVEREAERVGDSLLLSEADKQVLALALELKSAGEKPIIVTDDYSIQ
ncbi:ribonuclease VapC, partial [Candidatus Bathyarchaeota archaeon]